MGDSSTYSLSVRGRTSASISLHYKPSVSTPFLQSGAKRRCFDYSGLRSGHVVLTFGAGSGRSFTRRGEWGRYLAVSEGAQPSIIVEFVFIFVEVGELLKVESVAEDGADATKAFDELVALGRAVGDELKVGAEVLVLLSEPLEHGALVDDFHLLSSFLVHEDASVLLLSLGGVEDDLSAVGALEDPASDLQVFKDDESLGGTSIQSLQSVLNTVADFARVLGDVVEVDVDELLLLDELDVAERLARQLDGLVEAVLASVGHVDNLYDLGLQTVVEQVGLVQVVLEIGGTGEDDTGHVDLVGGDEVLDGQLGDLADVVVTLLLSQTGETQGGLTTTTVLLRQINREPGMVSISGAVVVRRTHLWTISRVFPERVPKSAPLPSMMMKPNFWSDSSSSLSASVWNLLSHRYSDVLMGLKGSKSMLILRSLPSAVRISPQ
jgi:hypothetical protein